MSSYTLHCYAERKEVGELGFRDWALLESKARNQVRIQIDGWQTKGFHWLVAPPLLEEECLIDKGEGASAAV